MSASRDDLSTILISVRNDVMKETQDRQVPWEHSALRGRFYFTAQQAGSQSPKGWQLSEAAEAWDRTKDTNSVAVLELFVARYQDTYYADLARLRMEELKKQQASTTVPNPQPQKTQEPAVPRANSLSTTRKGNDGAQIEAWRNAIQLTTFRMQSVLPVDLAWAQTFTEKLSSLSGGKLKVDIMAPGTVVPTSEAQYLPAADIAAAFARRTIDGAEYGDPLGDETMGIHRVAPNYYYPSWHAPATLYELELNLDTWKAWSDAQRGLVSEACRQTIDISVGSHEPSAKEALERMKKCNVQMWTFPTPHPNYLTKIGLVGE